MVTALHSNKPKATHSDTDVLQLPMDSITVLFLKKENQQKV